MRRTENRRIRSFAIGAIAMLAAAVMAACGDDSDSADGDGPYRIGLALAQTGPAAAYGKDELEVARMMTEQVNAEGGINGRKIELVVADTKTDPTEAARVATKMMREDNVIAIFGATASSETLAFVDVAGREGTAIFGPNADTPIGGQPDKAYHEVVFGVSSTTTGDAVAAAEEMRRDGRSRAAVLFQEDAYGTAVADNFETAAEEGGIELVERVSAPGTATDVSAQARRIAQAQPDAVLLPMASVGLAAASLRALDEAGYEGALYGTPAIIQRAIVDEAGGAAEGMKASAIINPDDPSATPRLAELTQELGGIKSFAQLLAAEAMAAIFKGLESNPADGRELAQAVEEASPIEGYGAAPLNYTEEDHYGLPDEGLVRVQLKDGKFETLK